MAGAKREPAIVTEGEMRFTRSIVRLRRLSVATIVLSIVATSVMWTAAAQAVDQPVGDAQATVETTPVSHTGDAAG